MRLAFAGEVVKVGEPAANPDVDESTELGAFRVLNLEALVASELSNNDVVSRMHVRDLIDVGVVDSEWVERMEAGLASRLQHLLDTPDA